MSLWLYRLSALVAFPFITYSYISHSKYGFYAGLICAVILVLTEAVFQKLRLIKIMIALFGSLVGYFIYAFLYYLAIQINDPIVTVLFTENGLTLQIWLAVLCAGLCFWKSDDLEGLSSKGTHLKVLDISALMDGRVVDLMETNFLSGTLVIAQFELNKLHTLVASKDSMEAAKGRRGLDVVVRIQEAKLLPVKITTKEIDCKDETERIVKLAKYFGAEIVTLDFNINKIASLYNVTALNIRDLATALKPVVLPGESMSIFVMKEGKEKDQGVGYLDDGTMVVVEDGRKHVGKRVEVGVSSILQTPASRMIFAKIR